MILLKYAKASSTGPNQASAKRGQFDDLTTPAIRALQDDSEQKPKS